MSAALVPREHALASTLSWTSPKWKPEFRVEGEEAFVVPPLVVQLELLLCHQLAVIGEEDLLVAVAPRKEGDAAVIQADDLVCC